MVRRTPDQGNRRRKADNNEELFAVDYIVDKQTVGGRTEYLVKWRGYDESENSWEPKESLKGCLRAVHAFEANRTSADKSVADASNNSAQRIDQSGTADGAKQPASSSEGKQDGVRITAPIKLSD